MARDDVEHLKPDPRHLLRAVEALGSSPDRVIYIGDTTTDFKTAMDAVINFWDLSGMRRGERGSGRLDASLNRRS